MGDTCPKCSRGVYRGTTNRVRPDECAHEDGIGCQAYRHGVEVGEERSAAKIRDLEWQVEANEIALTQYDNEIADGVSAKRASLMEMGRDG